jgi:hypothetical protein
MVTLIRVTDLVFTGGLLTRVDLEKALSLLSVLRNRYLRGEGRVFNGMRACELRLVNCFSPWLKES